MWLRLSFLPVYENYKKQNNRDHINFNMENYCSSFGLHVSSGYDEAEESYSLLEDDTYCNPNSSYVWCLPRDYNREKHPFSCKYQARINWHFGHWDLFLASWKVGNLINFWNLILACYLQVNDVVLFCAISIITFWPVFRKLVWKWRKT